MNITLLMGSNATGKSTRMKVLADHLGDYEDYEYTFFDHKKDKVITVNIGRLYPNGHFLLGEEAGNHAGWVSMDKAILSTQDLRTEFYKHIIANEPRIKHVFAEGYFNMSSVRSQPAFLQETGFENADSIYCFYDNLEQFIERTEFRSGSSWEDKGKDPAVSAGWLDNKTYDRVFNRAMEEHNPTEGRRVIRMPIDAPRDYLVELYGQENEQTESTQRSLWGTMRSM